MSRLPSFYICSYAACMSVMDDQLKVKALRVLELLWCETKRAPLEPHPMIGFTLAYLFSVSRPRDREPYDQYWRAVTRPMNTTESPYQQSLGRGYEATAALNAIYRLVNVERTPAMMFVRERPRPADRAEARASGTD